MLDQEYKDKLWVMAFQSMALSVGNPVEFILLMNIHSKWNQLPHQQTTYLAVTPHFIYLAVTPGSYR